jgi:competence protein ComEC
VRVAAGTLAVFVVGAASMQRALNGIERSPLSTAIESRASATISAELVEDPEGGPYSARVVARVTALDGHGAGGRRVLVTANGGVAARLRLLEAGDRVALAGWFRPLDGLDARLRWRHIVARLDASELRDFHPPPSSLYRFANALRGRVVAGGAHLPPTERALVAGFLLGDTRAIPREVEQQFRDAGLSHLLAVSGANVAFVLALVSPVIRRLGRSGRLVMGLAVLGVFGTMTRWEPSVLRACAMAAGSLLAVSLGRPTSGLRMLALAAGALVLIDPFLVHSVGFLLSCGASLGIVLLARRVEARLRGPAWMREGLAVTIAAQIGVAPVLIPAFGSVPVAALPANLVAVPVAAPLTIYGLASGMTSSVLERWWPEAAAAVQLPTRLLARAVLWVATLASRIPLRVDGRAVWGLLALGALMAAALHRHRLRVDAPIAPR